MDWSTPLTAERGGVTVRATATGSVVFHRNEAGTEAVGFGVPGVDDNGSGDRGSGIAGRTMRPSRISTRVVKAKVLVINIIVFSFNLTGDPKPHEGSEEGFREGKHGVPHQRQEVDRFQRQRRPHSAQVRLGERNYTFLVDITVFLLSNQKAKDL